MKFYKIKYLINKIEEPNKSKVFATLEKYKDRFYKAKGSTKKHQAWEGGYVDHLEETMSMAVNFYKLMFKERKPDFTLSDAILVLFLHDIEKPFKYVNPKMEFKDEESKKIFLYKFIKEEKIKLNTKQINALKYIHGEGDDYHPTRKMQSPLSAFCHMCDNNSARIWFDYPKI